MYLISRQGRDCKIHCFGEASSTPEIEILQLASQSGRVEYRRNSQFRYALLVVLERVAELRPNRAECVQTGIVAQAGRYVVGNATIRKVSHLTTYKWCQ